MQAHRAKRIKQRQGAERQGAERQGAERQGAENVCECVIDDMYLI